MRRLATAATVRVIVITDEHGIERGAGPHRPIQRIRHFPRLAPTGDIRLVRHANRKKAGGAKPGDERGNHGWNPKLGQGVGGVRSSILYNRIVQHPVAIKKYSTRGPLHRTDSHFVSCDLSAG